MEQDKIWNFYQNDISTMNAFDAAIPRYEFISGRILSGKKVLNIGVGRGGLEKLLVSKGCIVSCLDPSYETIDNISAELALGDRAKIGYSQSIPFSDFEFDFVVMSEVLEHLSDDVLNVTIKEVRRILKINGIFIITVPYNEELNNNTTICPCCLTKFHRWGHFQSFTTKSLSEILLINNFFIKNCEIRAFPDWNRNGIKNFFKNSIRFIMGRFGANIASPHIYLEVIKILP